MLLDTHVLLWLLTDDPKLGPGARAQLRSAGEVLVSAASVWEIAGKSDLGKVSAPADLPDRISAAGLEFLAVTAAHTWAVRGVSGLPHRDPFDRLLVAQAAVESLILVTADELILAADLAPAAQRLDARG